MPAVWHIPKTLLKDRIFEHPTKLSENADLSFPGTAKPTLTSRNEWQGIAVVIREQVVEI